MLQAGDYLIAVNGKSVDGLTLTQAAELLKTDDEFVTLQIKKDPRIAGKFYHTSLSRLPCCRRRGGGGGVLLSVHVSI